jgi:hypothetical protein
MKRVWGHVSTGILLVGGAVITVAPFPACVHDNSTLFVYDVLAPQFVTAGMTCTFTADPTQPVISAGILDAALSAEYAPVFLVGNQVVPRGDPTQPHTETSFITIEGAVVTITDSNGTQLSSFTKPVAATVPPSSGTTPGFASLAVTIIDSSTSVNLGGGGLVDRVVSTVRFFGHTLGGESVESNDFGFPVDVCRGCLVAFPPAEQNNALKTPNCALAGAAGGAASNIPCAIGQDLPVDCSACQTNPICQGALANFTPTTVDAGGGG